MRIGTGIGMGWPRDAAAQAERAEAAGFDVASCGELAHDSIVTMTVAGMATSTIELRTSVTIAFPRSPMVLAMEAWDLQHLTGGRFTIGLGSQVKGHNIRRFGGTWAAAAPRMFEYATMMRAIFDAWQDGAPAEFEGDHYRYTLQTPAFDPGPLEVARPKIAIAAVGPAMARVAGRVADVVLPHGGIMSDGYMREVFLPAVGKGLVESGRTWSDIEIDASGYLVVGDDEAEIERRIQGMRRTLSFYGSTRTYHKVLAVHGLEGLGQQLHDLSVEGRWADMAETVTADHIRELAQTCTYDELPDFLARHREYATVTSFPMSTDNPDDETRAQELMARIRATDTPRVPRGLEL